MNDKRIRLQSYIRPVYGDLLTAPGPDGIRALVTHLLGVITLSMTSRLSGSTGAGLTYLLIQILLLAKLKERVKPKYQAPTRRYSSSLAISAQRIRAFLLASATAVRLTPRLFFSSDNQRLRCSFLVLHRKTIEGAP